ncbi:MAG: 4-hydroxy-tetrahydrodipicolinate reductase [Blastocatellia bacterium]|nr:4-hydroxy-tetrahydrodipicolinate reductase [Blastocatellia bacterium]
MKLKLCVAGATGNVGRGLVAAIRKSDDLELVGAVSRTFKGQNLGTVLGIPELQLTVSETAAEALAAPTHVLIDYTKPDVVKRHTLEAIDRGVHVVIGTSGLTNEDYAEIDERAQAAKIGVLAAGNFAITAVLMQRFALLAAKFVPAWEIIEYSGPGKPDAPSGTARELAFRLAQVREPHVQHPIAETQGLRECRGGTVNGSQIHSVRLPGFSSSCEVILGTPGEKLTIRHDSINATDPYVGGTLLAARKVSGLVGLVRGLDSILEF